MARRRHPETYFNRAGDDYEYFSLGTDWDAIKANQGLTNQEMFQVYNVPFLDDAIAAGKPVQFAHDLELTRVTLNSATRRVRGILYDAVVFFCGHDEPTGAFGAAIEVGNGDAINRVFGEHIAQDDAPEAIAHSLDLIHEYARLILPEAYLKRFAEGVTASGAAREPSEA